MRKILILAALLAPVCLWAKPLTVGPAVKSPTSFVIIVDSRTYGKVGPAIKAYKESIEKDGLATFIFADDWQSPLPIRALLEKLHKSRKMPLEGAVFIGDIPIPMIRDAQFLTSAFKMDQQKAWEDSSVPSDRYYDDFDLCFEYIRKDSIHPLFHYFSMSPESGMRISSDIYSARIRPMAREGKDKYTVLEAYLKKAVRLKTEQNALDDICVARGHGYNSEARDAWAGEQMALREQIPQAFRSGGYVRFYDFDMQWPVRNLYLDIVQRESADMVLFHHHGSEGTQYLNGYPSGSSADLAMENLKRHLRSRIRNARNRGKDVQQTMRELSSRMNVPISWMQDALDPETVRQDSLYDASMDITLKEIHSIRPNARFIMFDACYNGSFHLEDCIASAYIFGEGNTVVTQGSTVNSLQDKWPDEYLGILAAGIRLGQWGRHVHYLETHIIGDPTYRFANTAEPGTDLNPSFTLEKDNPAFWLGLVDNRNADIQAIALRRLYECKAEGLGRMLKEKFFASGDGVVRMECMKLLHEMNAPELTDVLKAAVKDSYELVRRLGTLYIGRSGADGLIPSLVYALLNESPSKRVSFQADQAILMMDMDKMMEEAERQTAGFQHWGDRLERLEKLKKQIEGNRKRIGEIAATLKDPKAREKDKGFSIARHRNHPAVTTADLLVRFAADGSQDTGLRVKAVEAIGWYNHSIKRTGLLAACRQLLETLQDGALKQETIKTINRLE